jgi:hypothetical protein
MMHPSSFHPEDGGCSRVLHNVDIVLYHDMASKLRIFIVAKTSDSRCVCEVEGHGHRVCLKGSMIITETQYGQ